MATKNVTPQQAQAVQDEPTQRGFAVRSLKARADAKRTPVERLADWLTSFFGTITFLLLNAVWFAIWIPINLGVVPGVAIFDPFPFVLLTTIVSIEAIFLAIIVLISQNRAAHIADVREEIDLHINRIAEVEVTQIIKMLAIVMKKQGIDVESDPEIRRMLRPVHAAEIERKIESQNSQNNNLSISSWKTLVKKDK